jgi:hypothetical protein
MPPCQRLPERTQISTEETCRNTNSNDSRTRAVGIALADGSRFAYVLAFANRPGVRGRFEEQQAFARVPRVSPLMALALKFQVSSRQARCEIMRN